MQRMFAVGLCLIATLSSTSICASSIETGDEALDAAFDLLLNKNFNIKKQGLEALVESGHPKTVELLEGVVNGTLRYLRTEKKLVWQRQSSEGLIAIDALADDELGLFSKRKFKRITVNNKLRSDIRSRLAGLQLDNPDPQVRLNAVQKLMADDEISDVQLESIATRIDSESDQPTKDAMALVLSLAKLRDPQEDVRLAALDSVKNSMTPQVRQRVAALASSDESARVREVATSIQTRIERRISNWSKVETIFFGLSLGSVMVLAAIGLAITFGVMGVINMAHGELIMLGAYTTYLMQQLMPGQPGYALLLSIPAAFVLTGLVGIVIERSVIRFLYGRPLETLLATFGISLILQQFVRTTISAQNVAVVTPEFLSGVWQLNEALSLTLNRVYIFGFCLVVFAVLLMVVRFTSLGLHVRAVSQNRDMARAIGIRSGRVDALTFGLGAGIAGLAGVALSQLSNVGPNMGQAYIVDSFLVVVFGGVGNLWGTLISGLSLGVINKLIEPWAGAVLAKILLLVFIILFIQKRPRGLFPQKGRAAEQ